MRPKEEKCTGGGGGHNLRKGMTMRSRVDVELFREGHTLL